MSSHTFEIVLCLIVIFGCMQINAAPSRVCENVPHASFVRHPRGCNSYYVCMNGVPFPRDCPPDLMFEISGICDHPQFVNCSLCSPFGTQLIRVPGTCHRYIQCVNGISTELQCSDGNFFDTNTLTCRPQADVDCVPTPVTTATPTGIIELLYSFFADLCWSNYL